MPTAAQLRTRLRRELDDFESSHRQGTMWSDEELNLALTASQFAVVRYLWSKAHYHLLEGLQAVDAGGGTQPLPADYMWAGSATVQSPYSSGYFPAIVLMGFGADMQYNDPIRYTACIDQDEITYRRGTTLSNGRLMYWRTPTPFSLASTHTELIDPVYDIIVYHAQATLQQKDWGQCARALRNMSAVVANITEEPAGMYPLVSEQQRPPRNQDGTP